MRRIQGWLLALYPRVWREHYEEEFVALLEQYAPSWHDLLDIFFNALYEQTFALCQKGRDMLHKQSTDASIFRVSLVFGSLIVLGILIAAMVLVRTEQANDSTAFITGVTSCFILVFYFIRSASPRSFAIKAYWSTHETFQRTLTFVIGERV